MDDKGTDAFICVRSRTIKGQTHLSASEVSIKQTPLQTDWVRLIRPFRGAATGQHLESSPRLPFELPEELAGAQWLARLCRTPD